MNDTRRKELAKAIDLIDRARYIIDDVKDEEQDAFDALPEGLQQSERGEKLEKNVDSLDEISDFLDDKIYDLRDIVGEKFLGW